MNKSKKLWLAIVIVVGIAIAFFLYQRNKQRFSDYGNIQPQDTTAQILDRQGSSDELSDINKDVNATNLDTIDAGVDGGLEPGTDY